jgi:Rho termination factor, N-terminal domain
MAKASGNETPNTPNVSETELRGMKADELRDEAKKAGVGGTSGMRKDELVDAVAEARSGGNTGDKDDDAGAGPDGGKLRTGPGTSDSLKYSQEVTSTEDEPEREGRSLATTHHEVIKQWAEERNAVPATVEGTEHEGHLGVLRFDFGGDNQDLKHVGWDEWFETFDARRLNFIYQEQRSDGSQSNFFQLENPEREDA